jgi:hypothetical protein
MHFPLAGAAVVDGDIPHERHEDIECLASFGDVAPIFSERRAVGPNT